MTPVNQDYLKDHFIGNSITTRQYTLQRRDESDVVTPVDLSDVTIQMIIRKSNGGSVLATIIEGNGITKTDATNGQFTVGGFNVFTTAGEYPYELTFIYNDGTTKTYLTGLLKIVD
ncbi:MAG: hypothetical protein AAGC43_04630 [Bacteroidota bacterium]